MTDKRREEAPEREPSEGLEREAEAIYEQELRVERLEDEATGAERASRPWPLAREHELLGAIASVHRDGTPFVERYATASQALEAAEETLRELGEWEATEEACGLSDLSDLATLLIGGEGAASFMATVFSAPLPRVGEVAYALALSGDGSVVAPVLVGVVAEDDFLVWTPIGLAEGLRAWLDALAVLTRAGERIWPGVVVEDPVQDLVCLALIGPETRAVLGDYLSKGEALPAPGELRRLLLDRIVTTCLALPSPGDAWLVFLPPVVAPTIWRSLLSFEQVTPIGTPVVWGRLVEGREGLASYLEAPIRPFMPDELGLGGLLRPEGGFIGARSLGIGAEPDSQDRE